jgi:hypothetical protein
VGLQAGARLGRYEILAAVEPAASGGISGARHPAESHDRDQNCLTAADSDLRARVQREARTIAGRFDLAPAGKRFAVLMSSENGEPQRPGMSS